MHFNRLVLLFLFVTILVGFKNESFQLSKKPKPKPQMRILSYKDTLYDKQNGNIYVLDKNRIYVSAFNKKGQLLWKTDPALDSFLPYYRHKRPVIIYFEFNKAEWSRGQEVIGIIFSNSQLGYLKKNNGRFYWQGQD